MRASLNIFLFFSLYFEGINSYFVLSFVGNLGIFRVQPYPCLQAQSAPLSHIYGKIPSIEHALTFPLKVRIWSRSIFNSIKGSYESS